MNSSCGILCKALLKTSYNMSKPDTNDMLPCIEVETTRTPTFSVICLHGLGADGSDFEPVVPQLGLDPSPGIRFVFPHAPSIPVTCNGGYVMPAWYDIVSLDSTSRQVDVPGVIRSRDAIRQFITRENQRGVPCSRVFLAGFSQGGAIAYATALTHSETLAGVIALSTYIPTENLIAAEATEANKPVPIFAGHGNEDDVVAPELGIRARNFLAGRGYHIEWHEYPMTHSVCLEEIQDIGVWLKARLVALTA